MSTAFNKSIKTTILVDNRGRTLYMFGLDGRNGTPTCTDDSTYHCSKAWPPLREPSGFRALNTKSAVSPFGGSSV